MSSPSKDPEGFSSWLRGQDISDMGRGTYNCTEAWESTVSSERSTEFSVTEKAVCVVGEDGPRCEDQMVVQPWMP